MSSITMQILKNATAQQISVGRCVSGRPASGHLFSTDRII